MQVVIRPGRRLAALVGTFVAVVALVLPAGPAAAHAELVESDPVDNAVVAESPRAVTLRFSEGIETALGALRLFDATGEPVTVGPTERPDGAGDAVRVSVPELARGTYLVAWRVTSADGHPIQGSFLFSVGERSAVTAGVAEVLARAEVDPVVNALFGVVRWLVYASFIVFVGGLAFVAFTGRVAPRTLPVIAIGGVALIVTSLLSIAFQGGYATAASLGGTLQASTFTDTVRTAFGRQALARAAVTLAALALVLVPSRVARFWWRDAALVVGPALAATIAYSGHAHTGRYILLGLLTDIVHLIAAAWWLGGLTVLAITAVRAPDGRATLVRFSPFALTCAVVVIVSGLVQSWRQVGSLEALSTDFGRLLVAKLAAVVAVLVAAALTRRSLRAWAADLRPPARLRQSVLGELALGLLVLGVTAGLVATPPAREALSKPVSVVLVDRTGATLNIVIDPARVGASLAHLYVTPAGGSLQRAEEARFQLALPDKGVADLTVDLQDAGPNHFVSTGLRFPFRGRWQATVTVRFGDFDASTFTTTFDVR